MQCALNGVSELGWIHLIRGVPGRQLCLPRSSFGRRCPVDGRDKFDPTVVVPWTAWPCGLGVRVVGGESGLGVDCASLGRLLAGDLQRTGGTSPTLPSSCRGRRGHAAWGCGLVGGGFSHREIRRKNPRTLLSLRCLVWHGNALSTVTFGDESCWLGVVGDRLTKTDRLTLFTRSAKKPVSRHSWTAELDSMLTRIRCGFDSHRSPLFSMVAVV